MNMGFLHLKEKLKLRTRYNQWREAPHSRHFPLVEMAQLQAARWQKQKTPSTAPLISITIATWNRGKLLAERTLPSILNQTWQNFEVIIVGDRCTDDTEERIKALGDPRLRFYNLENRPEYPQDPLNRWRVAGVYPVNRAVELARGEWISYIDDDDVYLPDRLETLLEFAIETGAEFVYGVGELETKPNIWRPVGSYPPRAGRVAHSAVMYFNFLQFFRYDPAAWKRNLPVDSDLWERMYHAGVKMKFLDRVVSRMPLRPGETMLQGFAVMPPHVLKHYAKFYPEILDEAPQLD